MNKGQRVKAECAVFRKTNRKQGEDACGLYTVCEAINFIYNLFCNFAVVVVNVF